MPSGKPSVGEGALVCSNAVVEGDVRVGPGCVLHPMAEVRSTGSGWISLGENVMVEETAAILWSGEGGLEVGPNTLVQIGARVEEAKAIGANCVFGTMSGVAPGCVVGEGCVLGAGVRLPTAETLPDRTLVYSDGRRRTAPENPPPQTAQLNLLRRQLPNFHHFQKSA